MYFRAVIPRLVGHAGRFTKKTPSLTLSCPGTCQGRAVCSKNLPVWRRRSLFDALGEPRGPRAAWPWALSNQMRDMERFMDEIFSRRNWFREPFYTANNGKELEVKYNDQLFEVKLDVSQYSPEDVNVKIASNTLTVSAKFEENQDKHGYVSREFTRQFLIPEDVESESIESILTTDGHLIIRGRVTGAEEAQERTINITREEQVPENKQG